MLPDSNPWMYSLHLVMLLKSEGKVSSAVPVVTAVFVK